MDRELVFAVLGALSVGPALVLSGSLVPRDVLAQSARDLEQLRWRSLWFPLLPAALLAAAGIGWVLVEPSRSEALPWWVLVLALPFALLWGRAIFRAIWALRVSSTGSVATAGLLRPRLLVSRGFRRSVDREAFAAALLHERAHARHRDPVRLWIAQFATDLQWPCRAAADRLAGWRKALELARDEEARLLGADGSDLAAAVLAASRVAAGARLRALVSVHDGNAAVAERVRRLLSELPPYRSLRALTPDRVLILVAGSAAAMIAGAALGERILRGALGL